MKPVPPIEDLKKICFRSPPDIYRHFSIYFTRIALQLGARANHISFLRLAFLAIGTVLFFAPSTTSIFFGALCYQVALFLDTMDGAVARYNHEANFFGEAVDLFFDHLSSSVLYFAMSARIALQLTMNSTFLFIGLATILLAQYAALVRALYIEHLIHPEPLRKKHFFVRLFHQDTMRLLLFFLTIASIANFWTPFAFPLLVYFFALFIITKSLFLTIHLWICAREFPLKKRIIAIYILAASYVLYTLAAHFLGLNKKPFRDFLNSHFANSPLIKMILGISQ